METPEEFDFIIFGSGFGGSIVAMVLRKIGYSVLLLERGRHPRFVIGESSTPFANLLLERLAADYDLPFLRALSEWGSWQKQLPEVACGLKRGFTFYHHTAGKSIDFQDRDAQLLVAASPNDSVADTHWYRPEFDHFLVREAQKLGVTYLDQVNIGPCEQGVEWRLCFESGGIKYDVKAKFAIDASGAGGFLSHLAEVETSGFATMPPTAAVYAHFANVPRLEHLTGGPELPYPPDDAAVHHVFPGGWVWVLRFNNGITSAGAAFAQDVFDTRKAPREIWAEVLERFPLLREQFASAFVVTPFYFASPLSFRRSRAAGTNWVLLPSAAGFVDPLLSTGFALNLLGISRLGRIFAHSRDGWSPALLEYERNTFKEVDAAAELIGALYAKMHSFEEFAALSLLYFAALSYTETVWRLGKPERAAGFLLTNDTAFTRLRSGLCGRARSGAVISRDELMDALTPWDIAGLTDPSRRNWYPVAMEDLVRNRQKVGATINELEILFAKAGLTLKIQDRSEQI